MFAEISIYWKNDSNELMLLPEADVWTSGSDGMQVIGKEEEIERLRDAVGEYPSSLECEVAYIHDNEMLREHFDALRHFCPGQDFTDDEDRPLDDIGMFERLGAETHYYYLCYYRTPHTRSWHITGDEGIQDENLVAYEEIEAFTIDIATEFARQNSDLDGWVEHGISFSDEVTAQTIEDALTDEDIEAWHNGETTPHLEEMLEIYPPFQIWGSRTGVEPLSVTI